jgi:UDP:flavonoid glycosyltransferase YjiC (YdhE family)
VGMPRIIVAAVPVQGHVTPLRRIAADLAERGYEVVFITGSLFRESVKRSGLRFVGMSGVADYSLARQTELAAARAQHAPGLERLDYDLTTVFYESVPEQHEAVQRVLAEMPETPTVIVTDQSFIGHWAVRLGAPGIQPIGYIGVGVIPLALSSVDTAPFGLGLPADSSPEGRARNAVQNAMVESMLAKSTAVLHDILAGLGATEQIPFLFNAISSLPDRFLQLSMAGAEYPRSDLPPGFRYIGAMPAEPAAPDELPSWWDDVIAADRVVLVTQGTVSNRDFGQLVEPTVRALAELEAIVVVTTGREDASLGNLPANARVAAFVPYSALLPYVDVLISNAGYGGCLQALAHGVPLILAGQSEDKMEVSARLAWSGTAINLATETPSEAAIRAAVGAIEADPGYRTRARELQADNSGHDPFAEMASAVEEVASGSRY